MSQACYCKHFYKNVPENKKGQGQQNQTKKQLKASIILVYELTYV